MQKKFFFSKLLHYYVLFTVFYRTKGAVAFVHNTVSNTVLLDTIADSFIENTTASGDSVPELPI